MAHLVCQLSIYNSFPVIWTASEKKSQFSRTAAHTIRYDTVYLTCSEKLTGSQLSPPHGTNKKLKCETKNKSPHFCFPWRRPCDYHAICCMDRNTSQCLSNPRSMYPSIFNSFPVIRTASAKNRCFHVPQPTFLFPLETPLPLSRNVLHGSKDNSNYLWHNSGMWRTDGRTDSAV